MPSTIKAGTVNLEAANFGTIQHELLIFKSDLAPSAYPVDGEGNIQEDDPGTRGAGAGDPSAGPVPPEESCEGDHVYRNEAVS